jgi:hypothetical protein
MPPPLEWIEIEKPLKSLGFDIFGKSRSHLSDVSNRSSVTTTKYSSENGQ